MGPAWQGRFGGLGFGGCAVSWRWFVWANFLVVFGFGQLAG